jgi:quinol monooxygenase YgiN
MSTKLYVISSFVIQPGKFDEFMSLGQQAIEHVRTKDTGTTHYEWFFNDDKTQCTVIEGYADSNACLAHLGGVQGLLMEILKISEFSAKVLGQASPELKQAAAGLNLEFQSDYAVTFAGC